MNKIVSMAMILMAVVLFSCGPASKKGDWNDKDKEKYLKEVESVDLSKFGDKKQEWIDCYLQKLEANFDSYKASSEDKATCEKLALECNDDVFGGMSKRGAWSDKEKQAFQDAMANTDLTALDDQKDAYLNCYLKKLEENYISFEEANKDENGCEKYSEECIEEIMKK